MSFIKAFPFLLFVFLLACSSPERSGPDAIYYNGVIYTVDSLQPVVAAIAIKDGRILALGNNSEILALAGTKTEKTDLKGRFVMPGFIEGHGHFLGLGQSLQQLDLMEAESWDEIVRLVEQKIKGNSTSKWINGRGWHQEKWSGDQSEFVEGYPSHHKLSLISPEHPVILRHASGHALMANQQAMILAGITAQTPDPFGGRIIRDKSGNPSGVFEENAMDLFQQLITRHQDGRSDQEKKQETIETLQLAQQACLAYGITSFQDAGSSRSLLDLLRTMAEESQLTVRFWAMLIEPTVDLPKSMEGLPWIGLGDGFLTVRAIKAYMDGALGSHGAWLLKPYTDKNGYTGQNVVPPDTLAHIAKLALDRELQFCVHAIGDRANQEVLNIYEDLFSTHPDKDNLRWRIEHVQHLDTSDIKRFNQMGIIASMQPVHCISDAPFVEKRLGSQRTKDGAYIWRDLLDAGAPFAIGTDVPVESVNPFTNIYAAVTRKRLDNAEPFYPDQAITRKEALYAYTLGNAWAAFEEHDKGSLSPGKFADFIILSNDLSGCPVEAIQQTRVLKTILGGKLVYSSKEE
jgi:predicted amidohydrolase YtcJ